MLLLSGFNVYLGGIDDGIDLVARKKNKFIYVQVKTCHDLDDNGRYIAHINGSTLKNFPEKHTYIVLVLHHLGSSASIDDMRNHTRYEQYYVVISVEKLNKAIGTINRGYIMKIYFNQPDKPMLFAKIGRIEIDLTDCFLESFWQMY